MSSVAPGQTPGSGRSTREAIIAGEKLCLELEEHLRLATLPRISNLSRDTEDPHEQDTGSGVPDTTIRDHAAKVIESVAFAQNMIRTLEGLAADVSEGTWRAATPE
jgi:hypothetical protein